jgi:hypothetical protein
MQVIRIDYHSPEYAPLLMLAVRPLVGQLRANPAVKAVSVWRHWLGGPHLNLGIDVDPEAFASVIYPHAQSALITWLDCNPSRVTLSPEAFAQTSRQLARAENDARPQRPLAANNGVTHVSYDRPPPMGSPELGVIRDRFQANTLDIALDLIALREKARGAFWVNVACAQACAGSLGGGATYRFWPTSMQAHALAFRYRFPQSSEALEQAAGRLAAPVANELRRCCLVEGRYGEGRTTGLLDRWMGALADLERDLGPVVADQRKQLAEFDLYGPELRQAKREELAASDPALAQLSDADFPNRLALHFGILSDLSLAPMRDAVFRTALHLRYRIIINFIYGLFPILGISPFERACLCHTLYRCWHDHFPSDLAASTAAMRALAERALAGEVA